MSLRVDERDGRVRFNIHVQPRASRSEVGGVHGDALRVRVSAPPVDGAANEAVIELLAKVFAVGRRDVMILAGESSRSKVVAIEGLTKAAVLDVAARSGR